MSLRKFTSFVAILALSATALDAQNAPQPQSGTAAQAAGAASQAGAAIEGGEPRYIRPETPEQRQTRLGTQQDPGPNPDPKTIYFRFGKQYQIHRYDKEWARYDQQAGWVRPFAGVNISKEIYQENAKYVWVWHEIIDDKFDPDDDTTKYQPYRDEEVKYFEILRGEFSEVPLPAAGTKIRFEEASTNLPNGGSWRNTMSVADMNGDGHVDLVLPPERGPAGAPSIFLGDSKGNWTFWDIKFPEAINYGSVVAADLNKDKHMDLAFGVHLTGIRAYLGDGKGKFTPVNAGLLEDDYPTRRIVVTDVDRDGWEDIVTISEGPVMRATTNATGGQVSRLRAYLNRNKATSWESVEISTPQAYIGGDWLVAGNFNGDKYPDFIGASVYFNGVQTLWVSDGEKKWKNVGAGTLVPARSYYHAVTAGRFSGGKLDDAIVAYYRQWPQNLSPKVVPMPPAPVIVGIDRISFNGTEPKRTSILRWPADRGVWGMDRGDFDGDGKLDILYTSDQPRGASILLGDGSGNFKKAVVEGITMPGLMNYDVKVADLNADKRPDVILMYESDETTAFSPKNGKVQVFLNRGPVAEKKP